MEKAGLGLRKWVTNNSELQKLIDAREISNPDETENVVLCKIAIIRWQT